MTEPIAEVLRLLEDPGTFATRLNAPVDGLAIEVTGVGRVRLPIAVSTAEKLRKVARPAPFGRRDQTLHDSTVRNTWEIAKSRLKIPALPWKRVLAAHLRAIQHELGLPDDCQLKPVLDKMLVYERGQFFKAHQDSEKSDQMVASLVVVLPSEYSGGSLAVEHHGDKKLFHRVKSQSKGLSLLAFYADCHHEVRPVKSGFRVALTYQLVLEGPARVRPAKVQADTVDRLSKAIRAHFAVPVASGYSRSDRRPPERLVYLLDHEYTQRSLSWSHLKRGDRLRVGALQAAAERLGCECYMALADVHEVWGCVEGYSRGRFGGRSWEPLEDTSGEADDYELIDLHDSTVVLHQWLDASGNAAGGLRGVVGDEELCFTKPSVEVDPFKSEYEGYQGNYGNTVDRWYHRAALVMWPRENSFVLRAQASPRWAVEELGALPLAATAEFEAKVRRMLPSWAEHAGHEEDATFPAKLMKVAARIEDAALARGFIAPVGAHRLGQRPTRLALIALIEKHGIGWGKELFTQWTEVRHWQGPPDWIPLLSRICGDLVASDHDYCQAVAKWLLERETKAVCERSAEALKSQQAWLDLDSFLDEATGIAHVLRAAVASGDDAPVEHVSTFLTGGRPRLPLIFQVQVLQQCCAMGPRALHATLARSKLCQRVIEELEEIVGAPPRGRADWSIEHPLRCGCKDCEVLSRFLNSSDQAERDWPLNKQRRRHIHGVLDSNNLPVRHATLRRGSPFVLCLRKDQSLFSREDDHRRRLKSMLVRFEALARAEPLD